LIRFSEVFKRYPGSGDALKNIEFRLAAGEMAFCENISKLKSRKVPYLRRRIGVIFQDHKLLYDRTVFDNVALPLIVAGLNHAEVRRRVRAALDKVGLLRKERAYPLTLSGGEQQRVGIARAVAGKPPLLLADEPTGNLDPELSLEIMNLFAEFNRVGVAVLIASHDLELIKRLGYRQMVLDHGELIAGGKA